MKELGLGGRASHHEALAHRQRACVLGSGTSCARIVGPKPPKDLEGEKFAELLADRCSKHTEEACLTLAGAYSRGWLLVRDFDKARQVLTNACDDGVEGACKRLGRRPPR
jgi:TPR repeat protein